MKKPAFLLSLVYVMLILWTGVGFSAERTGDNPPSEGYRKSDAHAVPETSDARKSLYLYYRNHLSPYFSGSQVKKGPPAKESNQGGMFVAPPSSGTLLSLSQPKPRDGAEDKGMVREQKGDNGNEEKAYVTLNKQDAVGLGELNKLFPKENRKEYDTELSLGFKLTPMLDLQIGKAQKFERSEHTPWETRDQGWRIRLKKEF